MIAELGVNSVTTYNWTGAGINQDYQTWAKNGMTLQSRWDSLLEVPYFANVSIGWDDTPRFLNEGKESVVHYNKSPESFGAWLQKAKEYADAHPDQPKIITIYAWNEWVEGSYLEPDMKYGYGYLEAVKKTMSGEK